MHALRARTLLLAVDALRAGRRLVLIDVARAWPGADRICTPLKRLDRLLGNPRLQAERANLFAPMAPWLLRRPQPLIVIDWCRLKPDGHGHLLRAAVPMGGRTLTLLDIVQAGKGATEDTLVGRISEPDLLLAHAAYDRIDAATVEDV